MLIVYDKIKNLISKTTNFIKDNKALFLVCLINVCLISYILCGKDKQESTSRSSLSTVPVSSTEIHVTPKTSPTDPDLSLTTHYTAKINDTKVEVPVSNVKPEASTSAVATGGATPVTANVVQTLDLTPVTDALRPDWEVGVGVGRHGSDTYIPVSIQRNYKYNKAVYVELQYQPSDNAIKGFAIQHKWSF